jgi:hypothetical protein
MTYRVFIQAPQGEQGDRATESTLPATLKPVPRSEDNVICAEAGFAPHFLAGFNITNMRLRIALVIIRRPPMREK